MLTSEMAGMGALHLHARHKHVGFALAMNQWLQRPQKQIDLLSENLAGKKTMVSVRAVRKLFRSNADDQSDPSEVADIRGKLEEEDRTGKETTFPDDSSGGSVQQTLSSAGSMEEAIHRIIEETEESLGAQNKSNSSSDFTSSSRPVRSSKRISSSNDQSAPQQDLENSVNSAVIADCSTGSSVITKSPKIRSKSYSRHKRVLDLVKQQSRLR
jgi:hypothetical protein